MNDVQTIETLKSLRLSGMAEAYETILRLGPKTNRTISEVVAQMTEAEWNTRQHRKTERLLKNARLRIPASIDEIEFSPERNLDRSIVEQLTSMEWVHRGATILITGPTGAGKSFLACAFGHEACLRGLRTRYHGAAKLFPFLRMARGDGSYAQEIRRLANTALLIIDDFGLTPLEPDDRLALLEILDDRYHKAATIVSAQIPMSAWHQAIGDFLAARLRLVLHPRKSVVFPTTVGLDFCGFRLYHTHRRLRRSSLRRFVRRFRRQRAAYQRGELTLVDWQTSLGSWIAHAAHGDTWRLRRRIFADYPINPSSQMTSRGSAS